MAQQEDPKLSQPNNITHKSIVLSESSTQGKIYLDTVTSIEETIIKEPKPGYEGTLRSECIILKKLKGVPNIAQLKDREECTNKNVQSEYYGKGDFFDYLVSIQSKSTAEPKTKLELELRLGDLFFKLINALSACHSRNIYHFDIKPENIFLKGEGSNMEPYLGDFGFAIDTSDIITSDNIITIKERGTKIYMPPEKLLGEIELNELSRKEAINYVASKIDIYGLGMVFANCIIGGSLVTLDYINPGFSNEKKKENLEKALDVNLPRWIKGASPKLTELLKEMLNKNPLKRWSMEQIKASPWYMDQIKASSWYNDGKVPSPILPAASIEFLQDPDVYKALGKALYFDSLPVVNDPPFSELSGRTWYLKTESSSLTSYAYSSLIFRHDKSGNNDFNIKGAGKKYSRGAVYDFTLNGYIKGGKIRITRQIAGFSASVDENNYNLDDILKGNFKFNDRDVTTTFSLKMPEEMEKLNIPYFPPEMKNLNTDFVAQKKYLSYKSKYLKYKQKYLHLKNLIE